MFYQDFLNSIVDVVIEASVYLQGYFIYFYLFLSFYKLQGGERREKKKIKKENNTELTSKPNNNIIDTFEKILTR